MAKKPHGLWKRKSNGFWYTSRTIEIDGAKKVEQIKLSTSKKEASDKLSAMLTEEPAAPSDESPIGDLLAAYLLHVERSGSRPRYKDLKIAFKDFATHFGDVMVKNLRPAHMVEWADLHSAPGTGKNRPWSKSTITYKVNCIRTALNWGVTREELRRNPLGKYHGPGNERRENLVTKAEYETLVKHAYGWLKDLLIVQGQTGCRPSEMCAATAADYDPARKCITLKQHKTKRKKVGQRVIWLSETANEVVARLAKVRKEGPLLVTKRGSPVSKYEVVRGVKSLKEACEAAGEPVSKEVTAYSLRHFFVTNALSNGLDVSLVATLCGNTVPVLMRNYSHLLQRPDTMQAAVQKAVGS